MGASIFLSHSDKDKPRLQGLVNELNHLQLSVLVAWEGIKLGYDFVDWINHSINTASHLIVAWSKNSAYSDHVRNEYHAFYAIHPEPGAILFLRLDDIEMIDPIFAARQWLRWRIEPAEKIAERVMKWVDGKVINISPRRITNTSDDGFLKQFSKVRVPFYEIKQILIDEYAEQVPEYVPAMTVLKNAISMVNADDPEASHVRASYLPGKDAPIMTIWHAIFDEACKHGAKMVAALVHALPDDHFDNASRQARKNLLSYLKTL